MKVKNKLTSAIQFGLVAGIASLTVTSVAFAQDADKKEESKSVGKVTVTGSRIKRAAAEGGTPVTILTRQDLDRAGKVSIADVLRDTPTATFGNYRPQSGNSAQALATIDLGGLGASRTLVLLDGRRMAKAPYAADSNDLNAIPASAVERVEILTDGASAVYGSDAIGGVVNIVLRKNFDGVEARIGMGQTAVQGGDTSEWSVVFGSKGERGSVVGGVSGSERGMVYTRDQIGYTQGISSYGNNYTTIDANGNETSLKAYPGFSCNSDGFWMQANGRCSFDFNAVAANEASIKSKGMYMRGDYNINDNWSVYAQAMVQNIKSFGRYAPTPAAIQVADGTPNDVIKGDGLDTVLYHRLAAFGNRDTRTNATMADAVVGVKGRVWDKVDVDFGLHRSQFDYTEKGTGYTVNPLLVAAIESGAYDVTNPFNQPLPDVTATIGRDSYYYNDEMYANAAFDLFQMRGGMSKGFFGLEYRKERFADNYDSLSEAGLIDGSAGNSSGGTRKVGSAAFEWLMPFAKNVELSLAGRFDHYSDYGSDFSPKASIRWQVLPTLTLRGSYGHGFRAPDLAIVTQKTSFSAETVTDPVTCGAGNQCQVDTYFQANPALGSEKSKQWLLGFSWDATKWFNVTYDYRDIRINDLIRQFSGDDLVQRELDPTLGAIPAGMSIQRNADGTIRRIFAGYGNAGDLHTRLSDLKLRTGFNVGGGKLYNQFSMTYTHKWEEDGIESAGRKGSPKARAALQNTYSIGDWTFGTSTNYIKGQNDATPGGDPYHVGGYTTHDLFATYNTPWNGTFQVGVNNVGNRYPQLYAVQKTAGGAAIATSYDGRPWNFYLYDAYGRTVYFRYTQRF